MPAPTPNVKIVEAEVKARYPEVASFGIYNCRPIRNSSLWSQHSWANAWDITSPSKYGPRNSTNLRHMKYLDGIYAFLVSNKSRLNIRIILWRTKDHWDHIHVDMWPKGISTPPCGGGSLRVLNRDGTVGDSFGEDDLSAETEGLQRSLNTLGFKGKDGKELKVDGVYGANTEYAELSYMKASLEAGKLPRREKVRITRL